MEFLNLFYMSLFEPLIAFDGQVTISCGFAIVAFAFILVLRWLFRV